MNIGGSKQLAVDLVILNERAASYAQDLQRALEGTGAHQLGPRADARRERQRLSAARRPDRARSARRAAGGGARVDLSGRRGSLAEQLEARARQRGSAARLSPRVRKAPAAARRNSAACRRRCNSSTALAASPRMAANMYRARRRPATTPAPWINVIANPRFRLSGLGARAPVSAGR